MNLVQNNIKCIMIVDDDVAISEVIKEVLQDEGFRVISARTGGQMYDLLHTFIPHLFILDYWISGGENGLQLAKWLREELEYEDIPIIFTTATDDIPNEMRQVKNSLILEKPFDLAALIGTVRKTIR